MTHEPDCCCFCRAPVSWTEEVRAPCRGTLRIAHTRCCYQLTGGQMGQMSRADRGKVQATLWPRPNPRLLGLTPRIYRH